MKKEQFNIARRGFVQGTAGLGVALVAQATGAAPRQPMPSYHDPLFSKPYIDVDEWRDMPSKHRYVHGGFSGTDAKFLIQLPPKEQYQGRFFQHNTAIPTSELLAGKIWDNTFDQFCFDSGAIAVVTNQGGFGSVPQAGKDDIDPRIGSYRVAAATAMYVREIAQKMYGIHRTYGYAFGGSGGGYRTLACAENTDAWDGVLPYIHGNAHAWPNGYAGRARAQRILKAKMPRIADAIEPGGGNIGAGLSDQEQAVLAEVGRLGFPTRAWTFNETMGIGPLTLLFQNIQTLDPEYFELFWKTPGYLGHDSPDQFSDVRIQHRARVRRVIMSNEAASVGLSGPGKGTNADPDLAWRTFQADYGAPLPVALELDSVPPVGSFIDMANIDVISGASEGKWLVLAGLTGTFARIQFNPAGGSLRDITEMIKPGDEVMINNSNILAYETYYRHALLPREYYVGDQFRKADGTPIYPQRPKLIAYELMKGSTPELPKGKFACKMIVIQNLLDWDAQPWYADFYRRQVRQQLGSRFEDQYRLYYTDFTTHGPIPDVTRTVTFAGALQQALRDLAMWVENGTPPPRETAYEVEEGQIVVPAAAGSRRGIQPVVTLKANGGEVARVSAGQPVSFTAVIETPPGAGKIVSAEWDFAATTKVVAGGEGRFPISDAIVPSQRVTLTREFSFDRPGTYFPALRVHSNRSGNGETRFAKIASLGRVRVVVT